MNDKKELVPDVDIKMDITTVLTRPLIEMLGGDGLHSLHVDVSYKQFVRQEDGELEEVPAPLSQSLMAFSHGVVSVLRCILDEIEPAADDTAEVPKPTLPTLGVSFCNLLMEQIFDIESDKDIAKEEAFDGFEIPDELKEEVAKTAHLWNRRKM